MIKWIGTTAASSMSRFPALGGLTPRAAVKTGDGRTKVVEWLKMMENMTAKSGADNSAMASYSFAWLWKELGLGKLRQ